MSLLDNIRRGTDSIVVRIFFGIIVVVFIFFGVDSQSGTGDGGFAAKVNGDYVSITALRFDLRRAERLQNAELSEDDRKKLQQDVLDQLIEKTVMLQEAERIGVTVSDEEVLWLIAQDDSFHNKEGKFDPKIFEKLVKNAGFGTTTNYQEWIRDQLTLNKMLEVARASTLVTDAQVKELFTSMRSSMTVRWVRIPDDNLLAGVPVDDAAVDAWIAANASAIKADYDADPLGRYHRPRKAGLSVIALRTDMAAGAVDAAELERRMATILAEAKAGADFATLARTWSEDLTAANGGVMGLMTELQLEPAVATAVFAATPGSVTEVVKTALGYEIYKVSEIIPAEVVPLETAQREIAREQIARGNVATFAKELGEKVLARWKAEGKPPEDLLSPYAVSVETSTPFAPSRPSLIGVESAPLKEALGKREAAGLIEEVFAVEGGRVIAEVITYEAADLAQFEAEKDRLRAQVTYFSAEAFVQRWKKDLVDRATVERLVTL